ncbi:MAG: S8 family serine peptidase [Cyclobacteriaceae bacterium]|nr:S8 family serine peptidase [Cyclobacteriaceae bacterium]
MKFKSLTLFAILLTWIAIVATSAQSNLSPALKAKKSQMEAGKTILSISVTSPALFRNQYEGKISILKEHKPHPSFEITLLRVETLDELIKDSNITFIDRHSAPKSEADFEFSNTSFNRITKVQQKRPDLQGTNYKISVKELSFDSNHPDLINRSFTTSVTPSAVAQHATNMAILIGGGGNSSYRTKGVAPNALLTSSDFSNLFPDATTLFTSNSITIQNHSYGVDIENYYGSEAVAYDQQVSQNTSLLHVFSAGNNGKSKPASGTYQNLDFANITGNFKQAKNVLVINAVDSTLALNELNSRGPAYDGRIKPELTAFGQGGTSDAAALVSGISVLLHEKYKQLNNELPEAALVKAILIASADDLGTLGPDFLYGYGSVNAFNALQVVENAQYSSPTISSNTETTFTINVPPSTAELKIAVAWTDVAATINATSSLVNDIDTWIDNGSIIRPWVLSHYPKGDSLLAPAKRKEDHLNNVEYITISNPSEGTLQLHISAKILSGGSQPIAIAYAFKSQQVFSWDYPQVNELVEGGKKNLLVWESTSNKKGDLYVQLNQGAWQLIQSNLDLNRFTYWKTPDSFAQAKLKMAIDGQDYMSETFTIAPLPKLKTAFICNNNIALTWNKINEATGYDVFALGNQYLEKIATVTDTVYTFSANSKTRYAVMPWNSSIAGLKSESIDYTLQGTLCYINYFSATRVAASTIQLQLAISTLLNIQSISIYRTTNGVRSAWKSISSSSSLNYTLLDLNFESGLLEYEAEITLADGSKIKSDIASILVEEKDKLLLYPNPVTASEDLNILSSGGGKKFLVLDMMGKRLAEMELQEIEESIDLISLPIGVYVYQLFSPTGALQDSGRFIKR